jgi:hypothetical protein
MIYELREYEAVEGKLQQLHNRFESATLGLFSKHGIQVLGFWTQQENPNVLVYLCRFEDKASMDAAWQAFGQDPEWKSVKQSSEAEGALTVQMTSTVLKEVPYFAQMK